MFQFPANPAIGQIFNAAAGAQYKWNGVGWVPFSTTFIGGLTLTGPLFLPDGTVAAPSLAFANETSMGLMRPVAGQMTFVVGGVAKVSIQANLLTVGTPSTFGGLVTTSNVCATGGGPAAPPAGSALLSSAGLSFVGAGGAGVYRGFGLYTASTTGTYLPIYQWINSATNVGYHLFNQLPANSQLQILGAGYHGGVAGVTFVAGAAGKIVGGIDMRQTTATVGAENSIITFSIQHSGTLATGGDVIIQPNSATIPQLLIYGGVGANNLSDVLQSPLSIRQYNPGALTSISMAHSNSAVIWAHSGYLHYWGSQGGTGLVGGWASTLTDIGIYSALRYDVLSSAAIKSDVHTITHALRDLLRLRGVRYTQNADGKPTMGFVAQEVETVFPILVNEVPGMPETIDAVPEKFKTLNIMALTAPIIEAMRELDARIKTLEATV